MNCELRLSGGGEDVASEQHGAGAEKANEESEDVDAKVGEEAHLEASAEGRIIDEGMWAVRLLVGHHVMSIAGLTGVSSDIQLIRD